MFNQLVCLLFLIIFANWSTFADSDYSPRPEKGGQELILCRKCGADIADTNYLFSKQSPGASKIENRKLFGKQNLTVQTLINPYGVQFEIVTIEKARCENVGLDQGADSWFPGYTWRICACKHCGQHLGWTFKRSESALNKDTSVASVTSDEISSFNGLILTNILGENFTDSLIMMPKMYKM